MHDEVGARATAAGLTLLLLLPASTALAQGGYAGSVTIVRSRDDTARSDAVYLFNGIDWSAGRIRAGVTLPFILQRTVWASETSDSVPSAGWQSGIGDPMVRADVQVAGRRASPVAVFAGGAVKLPIADADSGLGSGKADVALSLTVTATRGRHSLLADVSYWRLGDPEGEPLRDVPMVYVGYATVLDAGARWSAIVSFGSSPSIVPGLAAPAQLNVTVLRGFRSGAGLGLTAAFGLTDGVADVAFGATWRVGF